jgi:hypothetical protein
VARMRSIVLSGYLSVSVPLRFSQPDPQYSFAKVQYPESATRPQKSNTSSREKGVSLSVGRYSFQIGCDFPPFRAVQQQRESHTHCTG